MTDQMPAHSLNDLRAETSDLMRTMLPRLASIGNPGIKTIKPWIRVLDWRRRAKYQWLEPRDAWFAGSRNTSTQCERGDTTTYYEEVWLGADGAVYVGEPRWNRYATEPFCSITNIQSADLQTLQVVNSLLKKMRATHFPPPLPPAQVECLGTTFHVERNPDGSALLKDSAVSGSLGTGIDEHLLASRFDSWPPGRSDQTWRLLLSWLYLLRNIEVLNNPFGAKSFGWDMAYSRPEAFLTGVISHYSSSVNSRYLDAQPELPAGSAPYLPGGPASASDVIHAVQRLLDENHAIWHQCELTRHWRADDTPEWVFVLTGSGARLAEEVEAHFSNNTRDRTLRKSLLNWLGAHARSEQRVGPQYLCEFLGTSEAVIDGIASSAIEVNKAMGWLVGAKFVTAALYQEIPGKPVGQLTERGFTCIENYGGDPMAVPLQPATGADQRVYITGGRIGNVATHSAGVTQVAGNVGDQVDAEALRRFAEATTAALPVLGLPAPQQAAANDLTAEIIKVIEHPEPDHSKLRALGRTLRAVVEGAASSALASGLLSLWTG